MSNSDFKEQGFVSIIAATTIMILVSLIVLGFTVLMQREQRQSLDRQLSTQAFYAAETGVNDVYQLLQDDPGSIPLEKNECDVSGTIWNDGSISNEEGNADTVSYSCLRYDRTPNDLVFTDKLTTASGSKTFPIESAKPGENVATVTFKWNGAANTTNYDASSGSCSTDLPASFTSRTVPLLRIDMIQAPKSGFTRQSLINETASLYLYPRNDTCGETEIDFTDYIVGGDKSNGQIVDTFCDDDGCEMTITLPGNKDRYFARVKSVYQDMGTLNVTATGTDPTGGGFEFKDAQTIVDSTGKANDVLRRIEVRLSNEPDYNNPEGVIEASEGFCKLISYVPEPDPRRSPIVSNPNCYD